MNFYKLIGAILFWHIAVIGYSQLTTYTFRYKGSTLPPKCNALSDSTIFDNPWKVSHGSPQAVDPNNQGFPTAVLLKGVYKEGDFKEKGEGIYIRYNFQKYRQYKVTVFLANAGNPRVQLEVKAANGITEDSNEDCEEDETPTPTESVKIISYELPTNRPEANLMNWENGLRHQKHTNICGYMEPKPIMLPWGHFISIK